MSETIVVVQESSVDNISVNISPDTEAIDVIVETISTPETTIVLSNEQGPQGTPGDTGATGPANTLSIGTVTGGASAVATITELAPVPSYKVFAATKGVNAHCMSPVAEKIGAVFTAILLFYFNILKNVL